MTTEELELMVESHEANITSMIVLFKGTTEAMASLLEAANLLKEKLEALEVKVNWMEKINGPAS